MTESSIARQNLMDNANYRPFCGNLIPREVRHSCYGPRTELRPDGQFICPNCKWVSTFPADFIKRYKERHNLIKNPYEK